MRSCVFMRVCGGPEPYHPDLEHCHDGPEERVEVLPVRQRVPVPLRAKLTAEQVHPQDTEGVVEVVRMMEVEEVVVGVEVVVVANGWYWGKGEKRK